MFTLRSIFLLLLLASCAAPIPDVVTGGSVHTGRSFAFAKPSLLYRDEIATVFASPTIQNDGTRTKYLILTSVSRNDLNYPKIAEAWSFGQKLRYRKDDRRRNFCYPACAREELGMTALSREEFVRLAQTGLAFQLIGKRGSYDGAIPALAFANVLGQAQQ